MRAIRFTQEGLLAVLIVLALGLQACIVYVDSDDYDDDHDRLRGTRWYVEVIVHHGRTYRVTGDAPYSIRFYADDFTGTADCNEYGADYEARWNGRFDVRGLYNTEVACSPNSLESRFFDVLYDAETYRIDGDELIISADGDALYFRRD